MHTVGLQFLSIIPPQMFHIPRARQLVPVQILQMVASLTGIVDGFIRSFPGWPQFALCRVFCCSSYFSKDEITNVEPFQLYPLIVVFSHLQLVLGHSLKDSVSASRQSKFSFNWSSLLCSSKNFVLRLVSPTSTGMIASVPQVRLKGVSPVGIRVVVLQAYRMLGNSQGHAPFAPTNRVLMIFSKVRFITSVCPLA